MQQSDINNDNQGISASDKPQLPEMRLKTLQHWMQQQHLPLFRARQVLDWRNKGIMDTISMTNLPSTLQLQLNRAFCCEPLRLIRRSCSTDGTRKYVFALKRGRFAGKMIESVLIPESRRSTICISSQVGCVLDCPFCHTGTQPFEANLSAGEIIAQILAIKNDMRIDPLTEGLRSDVTHIVYMGMGEPLANEAAVHQSIELLMLEEGLHLSRRRITLSTSGLVPQIERLGLEQPVNLAISLHAANDNLRDTLVPINRKHPLSALRKTIDRYPLGKQRHITLEYVLLQGINDRPQDLLDLHHFVNPERERINLIQFNPYPGSPYRGSTKKTMEWFAEELISKGIRATVRRSRGQDIMAACGQLKAAVTTPKNHINE